MLPSRRLTFVLVAAADIGNGHGIHAMVLDCVLVDLSPPSGTAFSVPASQRQKSNHTFRFRNTNRNDKIIEIKAGKRSTA